MVTNVVSMALWACPFSVCKCEFFGPCCAHHKTTFMASLRSVPRIHRKELAMAEFCFISQHS